MITNRPNANDTKKADVPLHFEPTEKVEHPVFDTPSVAEEALRLVESMSLRIDDLAREFGCLGKFDDDDDDRPRAA